MAQAPSSTASAASSKLVTPQILTRIRPEYGSALFRRGGPVPKRHGDLLRFAVAQDRQFHLSAGIVSVDRVDHVFHRGDRLAIDFGDDVAAELEARAFDRRFGRPALQPRLVGRAAPDHFRNQDAFFDGKVYGLRQRRGDRAAVDAEEGVFHLAVLLDFIGHFASRVDRDREADADVAVAAAAGLDLGVDPDHASGGIDQRPARVAGVDRGVGLNHVVDREPVGGLDLALEGGDDAARHRAVEAEGVADRHHRIAHAYLRGVAEGEGVKLVGRGFDLEQGDVTGGISAHDFGRVGRVGGAELDRDLRRAFDDGVFGRDWYSGVIT